MAKSNSNYKSEEYLEDLGVIVSAEIDQFLKENSRKKKQSKAAVEELRYQRQFAIARIESEKLAAKEKEYDEVLQEVIQKSKYDEQKQKEKNKQKEREIKNQQDFEPTRSHSKTLEELDKELQNILRLSEIEELKRQEQERRLKQERENQLVRNNIKDNIKNIIQNDPYDDNVYNRISVKLDTYEVLGRSIFETPRKRPPLATLNERSFLIIEAIKLFEYDNEVDLVNIIKYFKAHIVEIINECSNIQKVCKYNLDMHNIDKMSGFKHHAIDDKFVCVDIRGDGNCLWNSVSVSLFGDMSYMVSLRLLTAYTLLRKRKSFQDYIQKQTTTYGYKHELTFNQLVRASIDLNVWGDEMHVFALSLALRRPIYSYGSLVSLIYDFIVTYDDLKCAYETEALYNHFNYLAHTDDTNNEPILLHYNGENHYSVVLPMNDDVTPLIPKSEILEPLFGNIKRDIITKDRTSESQTSSSVEEQKPPTETIPPTESELKKLEYYKDELEWYRNETGQLTIKLQTSVEITEKKIVECSELQNQIKDLKLTNERLLWERDHYRKIYLDLYAPTHGCSANTEDVGSYSTNGERRHVVCKSTRPQEANSIKEIFENFPEHENQKIEDRKHHFSRRANEQPKPDEKMDLD